MRLCDCAIADAVAPDTESCMIEKSRHSVFFKTPLEELLRKMNRDQVVFCGVFAHHDVMVSTINGYMRNFQMTLVADALGDTAKRSIALRSNTWRICPVRSAPLKPSSACFRSPLHKSATSESHHLITDPPAHCPDRRSVP